MENWLACSYKKLTEEDDFADCWIIVGARKFGCHRVILGVASEFFKRAFQPGFAEAKKRELNLTDVTPEIFEKFRLYVYAYDKDTLNSYSNSDIIKLKECANMWMVEPLKIACDEIFRIRFPQMSYPDLLLYFEHAHHVHDRNLIEVIVLFLKKKISMSSIPEEIYELGSDVFREFLMVIRGSVTERVRYDMVQKYVGVYGFVLNLSDLNKWEFHGFSNQSETKPAVTSVFKFGPSNPSEKTADDYANPNPFKVEKLNSTERNAIPFDPRAKKINSEYVKNILGLIEYTKMTANEFFEGPGKSKMMTFEDKFNFMYKIATRRSI
ncbi:kelch-like protein 41b [Drosophila elegans]|uniref:kelch-like protein 41b n=1 Tax=Drosophila elegans TaxID=30023 RepID=UPI001BC83A8A|nr:kelch-like protein 41b [Drosophila elegans]